MSFGGKCRNGFVCIWHVLDKSARWSLVIIDNRALVTVSYIYDGKCIIAFARVNGSTIHHIHICAMESPSLGSYVCMQLGQSYWLALIEFLDRDRVINSLSLRNAACLAFRPQGVRSLDEGVRPEESLSLLYLSRSFSCRSQLVARL